jgi:hypothetical protein
MDGLRDAYFEAVGTREPRSGLSRVRAFYASMASRWEQAPHAARAYDWHEALLRAGVEGWELDGSASGVSITASGWPMVYCDKLSPSGTGSFRMVVEPGAGTLPMGQRVTSSLDLAAQMLGPAQAHSADELRRIADILLPSGPVGRNALHGAIWLGMACSPETLSFKAYVNCRHCPVPERWLRLDEAFAALGREPARCIWSKPRDSSSEAAVPVGLGLEIGRDGITGARLYLTLRRPAIAELIDMVPETFSPAVRTAVASFAESFEHSFGHFTSESVSVAFDYAVDAFALGEIPTRFKVELSCQALPHEQHPRVVRWLTKQAASVGARPPSRMSAIAAGRVFGGLRPQYASLGVSATEAAHASLYFQPSL